MGQYCSEGGLCVLATCEDLTWEGMCEDSVLHWCDVYDVHAVYDCNRAGLVCSVGEDGNANCVEGEPGEFVSVAPDASQSGEGGCQGGPTSIWLGCLALAALFRRRRHQRQSP